MTHWRGEVKPFGVGGNWTWASVIWSKLIRASNVGRPLRPQKYLFDCMCSVEMIDRNMNSGCMQSVHPLHSNPIMNPASPHPGWQFGTQTVKNEPMEEDKNDSGITSGSDFHSSSPGSDHSQDLQQYHANQANTYYRMLPQYVAHHPLTPPTSEPLVSPKSEKEEGDTDTTLTPCTSPSQKKSVNDGQDHLRRLEISLEKCGVFAKEPKHTLKNEKTKEDENLIVPRNSHGKVKTFKCKQCDFVAFSKAEQWTHSRIHIKEDKLLTCPKCLFVTEYKHHLEYHLRGHAGSKPFQCTKCEYTCVNKSMLNSHMKSHSNIYRYTCRDCSYATKYCHSFKQHLRKHGHNPNVVLDEEGNPCPDIIIDVHGTRRGPRVKTRPRSEDNSPMPEAIPFLNFPFPAYPFIPNPQILQQLLRERQPAMPTVEDANSALDLSKPGSSGEQKNRRKGPPTKIEQSAMTESDEDEENAATTMFSNVEVVQEEVKKEDEARRGNENKCKFCNITFGDVVMYSLHMGQHDFTDPFTCNICKKECSDRLSFFMHSFHP